MQQHKRIYLGGMDPTRGLTAYQVVRRLEARLLNTGRRGANDDDADDAAFEIDNLHMGESYCQFTVLSKKIHDDDDVDPLPLIKSWFHNVVWKGCKLKVDVARPHFLERLKEERQQKQQQQNLAVTVQEGEEETAEKRENERRRRRHWKVKRGYSGRPMEIVDTQPCRVSDWSELSRMRQRHAAQSKKYAAAAPASLDGRARKLSYYNRSIHLVFASNDDNTSRTDSLGVSSQQQPLRDDDDSYDDDVSTSASSMVSSSGDGKDATSSDSSSASSQSEVLAENGESKYIWSSSSSSSSSDDDDDDEAAPVGSPKERNSRSLNPATSSPCDDDTSTQEGEEDPIAILQPTEAKSTGKYAWSSDDESSTTQDSMKNSPYLQPADMDEFTSALDDKIEAFDSDDSGGSDGDDRVDAKDKEGDLLENITEDTDLQHDVEFNLQVLSQLFPEISKSPAKTTSVAEDRNRSNAIPATGWGAQGQMLRFDPSNPQSSNQFVLPEDDRQNVKNEDDDNTASSEGKGSESSLEADDDSSSSTTSSLEATSAENDKMPPSKQSRGDDATDDIYEQGKLEQVFKQVRQSVAIDEIADAPVASTTEPSGFSFGFDLKSNNKNTEDTPPPSSGGPFSFSFPVGADTVDTIAESKTGNDKLEQNKDGSDTGAMDVLGSFYDQDSLPQNKRRRRAFEFPQTEDLDEYVHRFYYQLNDGERMINDLEGWRNVPSVKERWLKERFKLTQDWKGKRKYALSKKKRRFG